MSSESASLSEILSQLETKTTPESERKDAYSKFSRHFSDNEVSLFSLDVAKNINHVLEVILQDVDSSSADVSQGALHVLGVCLHDLDIVRNVTSAKASEVIKKLCVCIQKTEDKTTCTRGLWCLGKQNLAAAVVQSQVDTVLAAVDSAFEIWSGNSITVEHECVNTISRLSEQAPKEMTPCSARWGKILLPMVAHTAIKVRERVLAVIEATLNMLLTNQKELTTSVIPVFKSKICNELKKLLASKHEMYVLKCWGILVQIFGEELHRGTFINSMLPIIELGFKGLAAETKIASYTAWQQLIDNFATNPNILSDPKRIKLLMQVFKSNNARVEEVARVKFNVWWHFVWLLGNKISANFDMVAAPMLQFCVGGSKLVGDHNTNTTPRVVQNGVSPVTPKMNLTCPNSQWPVFKFLQLKGCEVLAHFLGSKPQEVELTDYHFTLDGLRCEVITGPAMFVKNSSLFITAATELFINLGKDVPEGLIFHIWYSLVAHIKNAIEGTAKVDLRDTVIMFMKQFQVLVLSRVLSNSVILKMIEGVCCLPKKVLCSSAYNIGGDEMIHGTPALFLMELLLTPALLQSCTELERYHTLYCTIIRNGLHNSTGSLGFLEAVLQVLDRNGSFVDNAEMLWRFWSAIVQPLQDHITKTNEINQGDSLEHNFSCVYQALLFPVKHKLPTSVPQPTIRTLTKTWTELYKTVNRLAAMVTNAEANIVCEDISHKIIEINKEHDNLEPLLLEVEINICHVIITSLDFSSLGAQSTFGLSASPAKWTKKRQRTLENIHSLVMLLNHLQNKLTQLVVDADSNAKAFRKTSDKIPIQGMLNTMVDNFSTLFTHVSSSAIIGAMIGCLAQPIGELFQDVAKRTAVKVYSNAFQQKIEKLWMDISTCLQSRYQSVFDSELLQKLSPLLEGTLLHSRRQIKNQAIALWNVTFGKATSLQYPESLKPVLSKVKEKSVISLPGWVTMATPVIEETPISQLSQSQAPEPHIPGMPSPHKIHGSFLNKAVSPNVKRSPAKLTPSPKAKKKALGFDSLDDQDFVVIKSSPRKPRVLTDHQKEVMKERRVLPAMYNSLEISQDVSMMAHFSTDTQDGSQSQTATPTVDQPFSLFGSVIPSSVVSDKQEKDGGKMKAPEIKDTSGKRTSKKGLKSHGTPSVDPPSSASSELTSNRRRSVRFMDEEKKQSSTISKEADGKSSCDNEKNTVNDKTGIINSEGDKNDKNNDESSEKCPIDKTKEFQPNCRKAETDIANTVRVLPEEMPCANKVQIGPEKQDPKESLAKSLSDDKSKSGDDSEVENEKVPGSENEKEFSLSIPQNVLGAIGPTPESSSKSSESKGATLTKADENLTSLDKEDESQLLFSWTQKLNQLNKSPRSQSPLKKILTQNETSSPPRARSQSPAKSPKRVKKKAVNENFGNLDKWIIRSPSKNITGAQAEEGNENILTVSSATIVEETQSPTKFSKDKLMDENKMDSVMETPPKHDFSNHNTGSFGNSNRKLFQSSQDNLENIHEDSNIIAASPNSKSFTTCARTGTPVLKLTRLTDSEIKMYSPSRDGNKGIELTPTKSDSALTNSGKKKIVKTVFDMGGEEIIDSSPKRSHSHDDFSGFKPLEGNKQGNLENDGFFSKSLTDTDKVMLKMGEIDSESEKTNTSQSDSELVEGSQSLSGSSENSQIKGLFSQIVKEAKLEAEQMTREGDFQPSADIFTQESRVTSSQSLEMSQESQDEMQSQTDSQKSEGEDENPLGKEAVTPRGRKRKQETPKKTTPEDLKRGKKKKSDENSGLLDIGSAKKVSKRLQEKRERKENEKQSNSPPDSKTMKKSKSSKQESITEEMQPKEDKVSSQEMMKIGRKVSDKPDSSDKAALITASPEEMESGAKELPLTNKNGKKTDKTKRLVKYDESGNVIHSETEQNKSDTGKSEGTAQEINARNSGGQQMGVEDLKQKKETKEFSSSDMSPNKSAEDGTKAVANKRKVTKREPKALRKKLSSSQEEKLQKTPESRNSSEQPERKSTTKKKKAMAQKRVLKRGKDVVVNESDSNLDQDLSDDDLPLSSHIIKKAVAENLEKKIDEQLGVDSKTVIKTRQTEDSVKIKSLEINTNEEELTDKNEERSDKCTEKEETVDDTEAMDVSFGSDDIPLSSLKSSQEKQNSLSKLSNKDTETSSNGTEAKIIEGSSHQENKTKVKEGQSQKLSKPTEDNPQKGAKKQCNTSPVGNKLRSGNMKTRLRSGERRAATSPRRKKFTLKARHVGNAKKKLNVGVKKKDEVNIDLAAIEKDSVAVDTEPKEHDIVLGDLDGELSKKEAISGKVEKTDETLSEKELKKLDSGPYVMKNFAGMKDESTSTTGMILRPTDPVCDILDGTPTKDKGSPSRLSVSLLMRNSDSKLIIGSRRFEKRPGFARRSILKSSPFGVTNEMNSPKRDFHPIKVARIYSPTASPSASILKKRRLSDDTTSDTSSPPAKQRRVSFAEPLTETQLKPDQAEGVQSALQVDKQDIPLVQKQDIPHQTGAISSEAQSSQTTPSTYQSTQATPTPNTYQSTQESQLDDSQPVFPELIDCDISVEKILPQLTSSIWSRGLGQLVRARNIHTIAHLAALTETQIDSLPIKAPKVQTVKKVLGSFGGTLQAKKSKLLKSPKVAAKTNVSEEDPVLLDETSKETLEDVSEAVTVGNKETEKADPIATDIDKILASSGDLVEEINRLSQKIDQSQEEKKLRDVQRDQSGTSSQTCDLQCAQSEFTEVETNSTEEVGYPMTSNPLLSSLSNLASKFDSAEVQKLRTEELFQAQQFISDLQNKVLNSLRTRCHSPTS